MSRTTARRLTLAVVISLFVYALACYSPISWSPDGKYVAFVQSAEGEGEGLPLELWVVDVAANRGERIASGKAGYSAPSWSPDGGKIAFLQTDAETMPKKPKAKEGLKGALVLYEMKSKKATKLCDTFVPAESDDTGTILQIARLSPTWSPDGKRIAFDHVEKESSPKVMMTDLKGNTKVVLENAMYPRWSPDGMWIACIAESPGPLTKLTQTGGKIVVVRSDGTDKRVVADYLPVKYGHVDEPIQIAWAPNSRQIAYTSRVSILDEKAAIFLADLDGKRTSLVAGDKGLELGSPAITRDGKQIAFIRWTENEDADTGEFAIVATDVVTGKERVLTRLAGKDRGMVASLSWSPDGKWLAYRWHLRVIRLVRHDGSEGKALSADPTSLAVLVDAYREAADRAYHDGAFGTSRQNATRAMAYADDFARRFPTSASQGQVAILKAKCLLMLNRPQDAADLLDSLSFARPNPEAEQQAQFQLAECHVALGQYRDALAIWGGLVELFRNDSIAAQSQNRIKGIESALDKAQQLTEQLAQKKDPARYLELADVYAEELLDPKKAAEALQSLLKEFPDSKEVGEAKELLKEIKERFAKE